MINLKYMINMNQLSKRLSMFNSTQSMICLFIHSYLFIHLFYASYSFYLLPIFNSLISTFFINQFIHLIELILI